MHAIYIFDISLDVSVMTTWFNTISKINWMKIIEIECVRYFIAFLNWYIDWCDLFLTIHFFLHI